MYYLQLFFKCLRPIKKIIFYSGVQWYGCISYSIRPFLLNNAENVLSNNSIGVLPVNNGIAEYKTDEKVSLIIFFKDELKPAILNWLTSLNHEIPSKTDKAFQFSINQTLLFEQALNLRDQSVFNDQSLPITDDLFSNEIEYLSQCKTLTLSFITPLRLKRPDEFKVNGHKYYDEDYFDIKAFTETIKEKSGLSLNIPSDISICKKSLNWVDMVYKNSIGGIMGSVVIQGSFTPDFIKLLVKGQYLGLGKNTSFGFGQYRIKESSEQRSIKVLNENTLLEKLLNKDFLIEILESMDKEAIDFDGISLSDALMEKHNYLNNLIKKIQSDNYQPAESQSYFKKKKNGKYRTIIVHNFTDRFIFKALSKLLAETCDNLLSENSFAYRVGYGHHKAIYKYLELKKKAYLYGIKADIEAFFDNIPLEPIFLLLEGLLRNDPILGLLAKIYKKDSIGLTQGNALSPFLSNLYMISFDTLLKNTNYKMIRFADDFLILSKTKEDNLIEFVEQCLQKLGLKLALEKSITIEPDTKLEFLGHLIDHNKASRLSGSENTDPSWSLMFDKNKMEGIPVYLSYYNSYARSEKEHLIIEMENEKRKIPWKQVQRLVIIGKPRVSASVIKKALEYNKSIQFVNILGSPVGGFNQIYKWVNIRELLERRGQNIQEFSVQFIQNIVKAKIHNQRSLLQKNGIKSELLTELMKSIRDISDIDVLRGKEGAASAEYFKHFRLLVEPFPFEKREYYPPVGPVNAMLSLGYTLIYNRICESLISHGFYPYEGIYHSGRGNHKALASDLMEPFRFISDRIVLQLIHNKQIQLDDFISINTHGGGCTRLQGEGFKKFLNRFEWTMNQKIKDRERTFNYYYLLDESVKALYRSIVLDVNYHSFFLS